MPMINLKLESNILTWSFNDKAIVINESFQIKGVKYVPNEKVIAILVGERGIAEDLLLYNLDGTLNFSIRLPSTSMHYFSEDSNKLSVTCGSAVDGYKQYAINFATKAFE